MCKNLAINGSEFEVDMVQDGEVRRSRKVLLRCIDNRSRIIASGIILGGVELAERGTDLIGHEVAATNWSDSRGGASRRWDVLLVTIIAELAAVLIIGDVQSVRGMLHEIGQFLIRSIFTDDEFPGLASLLADTRGGGMLGLTTDRDWCRGRRHVAVADEGTDADNALGRLASTRRDAGVLDFARARSKIKLDGGFFHARLDAKGCTSNLGGLGDGGQGELGSVGLDGSPSRSLGFLAQKLVGVWINVLLIGIIIIIKGTLHCGGEVEVAGRDFVSGRGRLGLSSNCCKLLARTLQWREDPKDMAVKMEGHTGLEVLGHGDFVGARATQLSESTAARLHSDDGSHCKIGCWRKIGKKLSSAKTGILVDKRCLIEGLQTRFGRRVEELVVVDGWRKEEVKR